MTRRRLLASITIGTFAVPAAYVSLSWFVLGGQDCLDACERWTSVALALPFVTTFASSVASSAARRLAVGWWFGLPGLAFLPLAGVFAFASFDDQDPIPLGVLLATFYIGCVLLFSVGRVLTRVILGRRLDGLLQPERPVDPAG